MYRAFHASSVVFFLFLSMVSCGRREPRPEKIRQDQFFAEILKRESCRCLGEDRFFEENLLANPDPEVRRWCAIALGRIANPNALPWLYTALHKGDASIRAASAFAIGEIEKRQRLDEQYLPPDPLAAPELVRLLDDTSLHVRTRAVEALGKMGSPAESGEIIRRLERFRYSGIPAERAYLDATIAALMRMKDSLALPVLQKLSGSPDPEIQCYALNALVQLRDKTARSLFVSLIENDNPEVRSLAALGIGLTEDAGLAHLIFPLLKPRQESIGSLIPLPVRYRALQALGNLKNPSAIAAIQAAIAADPIDDAHPDQQNFAIQAASTLGDIGTAGAESAVLALLQYAGPIANRSVVALAKISKGNPERFFGLVDSGQFSGSSATRAWIQAMTELGGPDAVEELNRILAQQLEQPSQEPEILADILSSLAKLESPDLQETLKPFLNSHDASLLRAALSAYKIKPGSKTPWTAALQAVAASVESSDVEARTAILKFLKPWVREKSVQETLWSRLNDHERRVRIITAGLLRNSGTPIAFDSGSIKDALTDPVCFALAADRGNNTTAILETTRGTIEIDLFREEAPITTASFVLMARRGSYNGLEFARAVPGSLVETQNPQSKSGLAAAINSEISMRSREVGCVGMSLSGMDSQANSFFITLSLRPGLDGLNTCFGRIVSGMQVADRIVPGDRIKQILIKENKSLFGRRLR
jgi:peptidyl-prolyl cis-trans isomerase B (cyclophilin B)